jgi:hypothetical protein
MSVDTERAVPGAISAVVRSKPTTGAIAPLSEIYE